MHSIGPPSLEAPIETASTVNEEIDNEVAGCSEGDAKSEDTVFINPPEYSRTDTGHEVRRFKIKAQDEAGQIFL